MYPHFLLIRWCNDTASIEQLKAQLEEAIKLRAGRKPYALKPSKDAVVRDDSIVCLSLCV
jgi:hypothetical protein